MTKKITLVVSFQEILNKLKVAMKLLTMLLLIGTILTAAAADLSAAGSDLQQKQVTGKISDGRGSALAGVNIVEKGTTNGVMSDVNGNFSLTVASAQSVLSISFIGYLTQEITVGDQTVVNVVLAETFLAIDEIVVVGYSTQTRKSLTGAVSTVGAA